MQRHALIAAGVIALTSVVGRRTGAVDGVRANVQPGESVEIGGGRRPAWPGLQQDDGEAHQQRRDRRRAARPLQRASSLT